MFEKGHIHKQVPSYIKKYHLEYVFSTEKHHKRTANNYSLCSLLLESYTYYCKYKHCHTSYQGKVYHKKHKKYLRASLHLIKNTYLPHVNHTKHCYRANKVVKNWAPTFCCPSHEFLYFGFLMFFHFLTQVQHFPWLRLVTKEHWYRVPRVQSSQSGLKHDQPLISSAEVKCNSLFHCFQAQNISTCLQKNPLFCPWTKPTKLA